MVVSFFVCVCVCVCVLCVCVWALILAMQHGLWDLKYQTGVKPMPPAVDAQSLNDWTTMEFPTNSSFLKDS